MIILLQRRGGVAVGVVNGFLYAVGGHDAPAVSNPQQSRYIFQKTLNFVKELLIQSTFAQR